MKTFKPSKGRASCSRPDARFVEHQREHFDDGWSAEAEQTVSATQVFVDAARSIIARNQSPDVPFDRSINPYRGCEHGCVYCFARPTHAYLDLSPGIDFETKIFSKPNAAKLLEQELAKPSYRAAPIALGVNTDAYQPIERKLQITRQLLEVLKAHQHPVSIITKSSLIERDLDLLAPMAAAGLAEVVISVTTLNHELSRRMEPRAAAPTRRVQTIRNLTDAGVSVGVLFAPVIPALNDSEMETILNAVQAAGARYAGYVMLRLPHELKDLFTEWLQHHYPLKAERVLGVLRELRGGKINTSTFGERMTGTGEYARLFSQRFKLACKKLGLNQAELGLNSDLFKVPEKSGDQFSLF